MRCDVSTERKALRLVAGALLKIVIALCVSGVMAQPRHIVYIEASTVNRWKLDSFAARTNTERYHFEVLREYDFDKSRLVRQVVAARERRPDAVVLQECAAYFPGDLDAYKRLFRGWIEEIQGHGLLPVVATIVPPAHSKGWLEDAKDFAKERIFRRPSQYQQVVAFNEWLRALGAELRVPVFDLEQMLRISTQDRHMRGEYNAGDGIHLAPVAYERLDWEMLQFLDRLAHPAGTPLIFSSLVSGIAQ
jgi:lysophospholipase L1-like esterase